MGIRLEMQFLFITLFPIWVIFRIIKFIISRRHTHTTQSIRSEVLINIFAFYIFLLVGLTLFPIEILWGEKFDSMYRLSINIIPVKSIMYDIGRLGIGDFSPTFQIKLLFRNVGGNILLFIPLGILLPVIWTKFRKVQYCLIFCFLLSLAVEILQLFENLIEIAPTRICDIDDLILNSLGAAIGYLFYKVVSKLLRSKRTAVQGL